MMIQIYEVMLPWKRWVNSISSQKVLFLDSLFFILDSLIYDIDIISVALFLQYQCDYQQVTRDK